jgi:hypothetical protein
MFQKGTWNNPERNNLEASNGDFLPGSPGLLKVQYISSTCGVNKSANKMPEFAIRH